MNGLLLWLYEIPTFWLCVLFIAVFLIFSLAGLRLTRPWVRKHGGDGNDLANAYIAAAGVFYALLVGLISVATWENYSDVESNAAEEAAAISDLYRDFEGYPAEMRAALQGTLVLVQRTDGGGTDAWEGKNGRSRRNREVDGGRPGIGRSSRGLDGWRDGLDGVSRGLDG